TLCRSAWQRLPLRAADRPARCSYSQGPDCLETRRRPRAEPGMRYPESRSSRRQRHLCSGETQPPSPPRHPGIARVRRSATDGVTEGRHCDDLELGACEHPTGWVLERVQDNQAGPFGDQHPKLIQVEAKLALFAQGERHGRAADEVDHGLVDWESGIRIDDLV